MKKVTVLDSGSAERRIRHGILSQVTYLLIFMKESNKKIAQISVEEIKEKVKQSEFKCTRHFDGKLS